MATQIFTSPPVFIVGTQRSGTTMLGSMIGGHSDVLCVPEGQFIADLAPTSAERLPNTKQLVTDIIGHWRFKVWGVDISDLQGMPADQSSYKDVIDWVASRFGEDVKKPNCHFWVDHQPGHIRHLARLKQHFPGARVIHIVRDPRAVAASLLKVDWGPNNAYTAAQFWTERIALGFAAERFISSEQYLFVRYEDVVRDPECQMKHIARFLEIKYQPGMVLNNGLRLPKFTDKQHSLVGHPPDPTRLDSWKTALTKKQIQTIESVTFDLIPYLGYEREFEQRINVSERAKTGYHLQNQAQKLVNRARFSARVRESRGPSPKEGKPKLDIRAFRRRCIFERYRDKAIRHLQSNESKLIRMLENTQADYNSPAEKRATTELNSKIIWMYWHQGWENAPALAKDCRESWEALNPNWTIKAICDNDLDKFSARPQMVEAGTGRIAHYSDIVRLQLLQKHGGVWADASLWCAQPLDSWIGAALTSGFFAFHKPAPGRLISNWFLASKPNHPLVEHWLALYDQYWMVEKHARHYNFGHFLFEQAAGFVPESWNQTLKLSADGPHLFQMLQDKFPLNKTQNTLLKEAHIPVHKLSFKRPVSEVSMAYLKSIPSITTLSCE